MEDYELEFYEEEDEGIEDEQEQPYEDFSGFSYVAPTEHQENESSFQSAVEQQLLLQQQQQRESLIQQILLQQQLLERQLVNEVIRFSLPSPKAYNIASIERNEFSLGIYPQ